MKNLMSATALSIAAAAMVTISALAQPPQRRGQQGQRRNFAWQGMLQRHDAKLEGDGPYQDQSSLVQAVYCLAPPTDFSNWGGPGRSYRGEGTLLAGPAEILAERKQQASPITYVAADAPPFLIVHGTGVAIVAHRGGKLWAPENTLAAYRKCADNAMDWETDLNLTADGEIVLMHDMTLDRTTNAETVFGRTTIPVNSQTLAQIKLLDASRHFPCDDCQVCAFNLTRPRRWLYGGLS